VDNLQASLSKSDADGVEKPLGDVFFDHFALAFVMAKYDMKVDVNLKYESPLDSRPWLTDLDIGRSL
jgi:vacuolar protein sorting-associated protein 13A/C